MPRCGVPVRKDGTNVVNRPFFRRLALRSATGQCSALSLPVTSVNWIIPNIFSARHSLPAKSKTELPSGHS